MSEMAQGGELPDDTKGYYNLWVKVLEGHFMTLFQTPEYVDTLTRTVNALADFSAARDSALEDILSPVSRGHADRSGRHGPRIVRFEKTPSKA